MKKMKDKLKRKRVDWFKMMVALRDPSLEHEFIMYLRKLKRGRHLSRNRCAYYTLKKHYSTTTIDELLEKISIKPVLDGKVHEGVVYELL